jgi:hypothetical protein
LATAVPIQQMHLSQQTRPLAVETVQIARDKFGVTHTLDTSGAALVQCADLLPVSGDTGEQVGKFVQRRRTSLAVFLRQLNTLLVKDLRFRLIFLYTGLLARLLVAHLQFRQQRSRSAPKAASAIAWRAAFGSSDSVRSPQSRFGFDGASSGPRAEGVAPTTRLAQREAAGFGHGRSIASQLSSIRLRSARRGISESHPTEMSQAARAVTRPPPEQAIFFGGSCRRGHAEIPYVGAIVPIGGAVLLELHSSL